MSTLQSGQQRQFDLELSGAWRNRITHQPMKIDAGEHQARVSCGVQDADNEEIRAISNAAKMTLATAWQPVKSMPDMSAAIKLLPDFKKTVATVSAAIDKGDANAAAEALSKLAEQSKQMGIAAKGSEVAVLLNQLAEQLPQAVEQVRSGPAAAKQMKKFMDQIPQIVETTLTWFEPPKP
jgi:hypothetical protein